MRAYFSVRVEHCYALLGGIAKFRSGSGVESRVDYCSQSVQSTSVSGEVILMGVRLYLRRPLIDRARSAWDASGISRSSGLNWKQDRVCGAADRGIPPSSASQIVNTAHQMTKELLPEKVTGDGTFAGVFVHVDDDPWIPNE